MVNIETTNGEKIRRYFSADFLSGYYKVHNNTYSKCNNSETDTKKYFLIGVFCSFLNFLNIVYIFFVHKSSDFTVYLNVVLFFESVSFLCKQHCYSIYHKSDGNSCKSQQFKQRNRNYYNQYVANSQNIG